MALSLHTSIPLLEEVVTQERNEDEQKQLVVYCEWKLKYDTHHWQSPIGLPEVPLQANEPLLKRRRNMNK
jgi:hypothetical protein